MASVETRVGFYQNATHRANFTRMACNYSFGPARAALRAAERIVVTAEIIARAEFNSRSKAPSKYAESFDSRPGPIISIDGLKRATARVENRDPIASIIEVGPKNPGPRPQGGSSGPARHILARASQAHASSGVRGQG